MRESIDQGGGELLVAGEDCDPLREGVVRRQDRRAPLVAIRYQIEEQLAARPIKQDETELVDLCGASHKVDEVGHLTHSTDAANMLFHVVNERHRRRRSMIFRTNKSLKEWGRVLPDEDLAQAILDRVLDAGV